MDQDLPRKRKRAYQEHFGLRVEPELKRDLEELARSGVDVAELARRAIRGAVADAKIELARQAG